MVGSPKIDDFIIPDEEPVGQQQSSQNYSNQQSGFTFGQWGQFGPKVDLSSTFSPFVSGTDNNRVLEHQYAGGDTLDEPVWHTLRRDLLQIGRRLAIVIWPMQLSRLAAQQQQKFVRFASSNGIRLPPAIMNQPVAVDSNEDEDREASLSNRDLLSLNNLDWDLWGPLIFSLAYSVTLGFTASNNQTNLVFSGSFTFVWIFYIVIGLNIQMLGGNISFMSAISAAGYSMFPIVVGELLCLFVIKWKLLRLAVMAVLAVWSVYVGVLSLKCSGVLPGRVFLAVYPVTLMYAVLAWLSVIT